MDNKHDIEEIETFVHNLFIGRNGLFQPDWKVEILKKIEEIKNKK